MIELPEAVVVAGRVSHRSEQEHGRHALPRLRFRYRERGLPRGQHLLLPVLPEGVSRRLALRPPCRPHRLGGTSRAGR